MMTIKGTQFPVQLDLFSDNRHTILMNETGEMLRALDLDKALAIYADLLNDAPEDGTILQLQSTAREWRGNLSAFHDHPVGSGPLHDLWLKLADDMPSSLAAGVLQLVIDGLKKLPGPELIYICYENMAKSGGPTHSTKIASCGH